MTFVPCNGHSYSTIIAVISFLPWFSLYICIPVMKKRKDKIKDSDNNQSFKIWSPGCWTKLILQTGKSKLTKLFNSNRLGFSSFYSCWHVGNTFTTIFSYVIYKVARWRKETKIVSLPPQIQTSAPQNFNPFISIPDNGHLLVLFLNTVFDMQLERTIWERHVIQGTGNIGWQTDTLNRFCNMFQHQKSFFQFHMECIVKFFIKNPYSWSIFILLSNCRDSLTFQIIPILIGALFTQNDSIMYSQNLIDSSWITLHLRTCHNLSWNS